MKTLGVSRGVALPFL